MWLERAACAAHRRTPTASRRPHRLRPLRHRKADRSDARRRRRFGRTASFLPDEIMQRAARARTGTGSQSRDPRRARRGVSGAQGARSRRRARRCRPPQRARQACRCLGAAGTCRASDGFVAVHQPRLGRDGAESCRHRRAAGRRRIGADRIRRAHGRGRRHHAGGGGAR